jgi:hypothetical protein
MSFFSIIWSILSWAGLVVILVMFLAFVVFSIKKKWDEAILIGILPFSVMFAYILIKLYLDYPEFTDLRYIWNTYFSWDISIKFFIYLLLYLMAGALLSIFNWFRFVRREAIKYRSTKDSFLIEKGIKDGLITSEFKEEWESMKADKDWPPTLKNHSDDLVRWLFFWPITVVLVGIFEIIHWVGISIYKYLVLVNSVLRAAVEKIYNKITGKYFPDMKDE